MKVQWLFPVIVAIHNLEEVIWLPRFWQQHGWRFASATSFRTGALTVAVLAFVITYASVRGGRHSRGAFLLAGFCLVMRLNAIWHIGATIYLRSCAPGVFTATLSVLPTALYMLTWIFRNRWISFSGARR